MFKKAAFVTTLVVVLASMVLGASAVLADGGETLTPVYDDDEGWITCFADGRINGCTLDAPVAIFYTRESQVDVDANGVPAWNDDGTPAYADVVTGVEMWGIVAGYDNLVKVAGLTVGQIQAATAAGTDTILSQSYGYTFGYSASGYFWVTAPNGYSFVWDGVELLG